MVNQAMHESPSGHLLLASFVAMCLVPVLSYPHTIAEPRRPPASNTQPPTVVLVHGAWVNGSSWRGVVKELEGADYPVRVFATPLRGIASDAAQLRLVLAAISGPIVLVGHSYGGAVVTAAAAGDSDVKAIVYVAGFAPDSGEDVLQLAGPSSVLNESEAPVFKYVPTGEPTRTTDTYVVPAAFRDALAGDLSSSQAAVLASIQRPVTFGAVTEPSPAPAWRTTPSWYLIATRDKVIPPSRQLAMALRARSQRVIVPASHLVVISRPYAVSLLIRTADAATR